MKPAEVAQTKWSARVFRRQLFLFVLAVCVPCALLVALGTRTLIQERELAEKRRADRHQQVSDAVGKVLFDRLERIRRDELGVLTNERPRRDDDGFTDPATLFTAEADGDGTAWRLDNARRKSAESLTGPEFQSAIAKGLHAELSLHDYTAALAAYDTVLSTTHDPVQSAYLDLLRARVLRAAGKRAASRAAYQRVLAIPTGVRDEEGIPLAFYAGHGLVDAKSSDSTVQSLVRGWRDPMLKSRFSSAACYALLGLDEATSVRERCLELERAEELIRDPGVAGRLRLSRVSDSTWTFADSNRVLVNVTKSMPTAPTVMIAVRADSLMGSARQLGTDNAQLVIGAGADIQQVDHRIEGLGLQWPALAADHSSTATDSFYAASLLLALCVTVVGGYLLWRDVHREVRLAHLRSQFVASVSHELKTPLTSIRIFAETLRDRANVPSETRGEYLDTIARESERLTRLLQNVLDFSRIEQGERAYHLSPDDMGSIVERALRTLRFPLEQRGFRVELRACGRLEQVQCDADAVEQAVLNLVSNAMKYSGTSRRVDVLLEERASFVALEVRDFGIGISPAHQARLFERFYRAPVAENDAIPGTGLGLTLVQHIVFAHGGHVSVESAPGCGSAFTMWIPTFTTATAPGVQRPMATPAPAQP